MSNQIVITSGAKVRELEGVLTGTTGIVNALPINGSLGIPQLDVNGKILVSQLPNSVMEYLGTWNATTNTPYLVNGVGNAGDVYLVSVGGTHDFGAGSITFVVSDQVIYSGTIWQKASGTSGTVTSVGLSTNGNSLTIGNSPITTSGTITANFAGTSGQYINGAGNLTTFPTLITEAQTLITDVYNETGDTLTKGTVVYINGGHGNLPTVTKALATSDATSAQTYGVVQADITNMNNGHVVVIGSLGDLDTQAYANGTILYLSSTTAGAWTSTKQYAPAHLVYVGIVVRSHPTQGVVEIKIQNGYELDELHNVSAQSPLNNQGIFYNTSTSLWENKSIATALGYTPIGGSGSTGQVAFFNGGSTTLGGSSSLYWDNSTSRLGIGTNTPNASLGIVNSSSTGLQLRTSDTSNQYQANIYWDSSYGMVYGYNRTGTGTTANNITFYNSLGGFISVPESSNNNIGFNTINPQGLAGASVYDFTSLTTNVELRLHNSSTGYTSSDGSYIRVTSSALVIANAETSKSILINNGGNGVVTIDGTNKVAIGDIGVIPMTQQLTVVGSIEAYGGSIYQTVTSSMLKANASGQIIAAVGGTDYEYPLTFSSPLVRTTNTISMPAASTSVSGYLTSTDWNTFNNKGSGTVTSVSATAPVVSSGGATPNISMAAATTSVSGYLTSTDWNTFNNKFTLPSLTQGSILFYDGSNVAQNNSKLYWDNNNMRLGIGTQSVTQYVTYIQANTATNANAWVAIDNPNTTGSTALRLILNGATTSGFQYVQSTNMTQVYANAGDIQLINGSSLGLTIANTTGNATFSSSIAATTATFTTNDNNFAFNVQLRNTNTGTQALTGFGLSDSSNTRKGQVLWIPSNYVTTSLQNSFLVSSVTNVPLILCADATGAATPDIKFQSGASNKMILFGSTGNISISSSPTDAGYKLDVTGTGRFSSSVTASSLIKSGGTSSQFLKADGSVDSTAYGTFTLPSLTSGSVLFSNGSTIAQDNANFYWDDVYNRLGIGTNAPETALHIISTGATLIIDGNNGGTSPANQTNATLRLRTGGFTVGNFLYKLSSDNIEISNVSSGGAVTSGGVKIFGTGGSTTGLTIAAAGAATFSSSVAGVTGNFTNSTSGNTFIIGTTYAGGRNIQIGISDGSILPTAAAYINDNTGVGVYIGDNSAATKGLYVKSGGNVGIGNTPSAWGSIFKPIQIGSYGGYISGRTDDNSLWLGSNNYYNGTSWAYTTTSAATQMLFGSAGEIVFRNAPSGTANASFSFDERMRITSGGNVCIGVNSGGRKLNVEGTVTPLFLHNTTNASGVYCNIWQLGGSNTDNTSSYYILCDTDYVGVKMVVYGNGNLANVNNSYGAYSDIKLKENIVDATPKLDDLLKVKIRSFNLKGSNIKQIGVVAQELEEVFPSMIEESNDTIKDENGQHIETGEKTKSVKYSVFVPMLIKAMQEQQEMITSLQEQINELKNK